MDSNVSFPNVTNRDVKGDNFATFSFVVNVIIDGFLCVIGVCCNILSITVLQKDRRKLSMSVLLQVRKNIFFNNACKLK